MSPSLVCMQLVNQGKIDKVHLTSLNTCFTKPVQESDCFQLTDSLIYRLTEKDKIKI